MNDLIIFGAKHLYLVSILIFLFAIYKTAKPERVKFVIFSLLTFVLAYFVAVIARSLYYNPRPFVIESFEPLIAHEADNGFPSDHSLLVGAICAVVIIYKRGLGIALGVLALMVGVSRILSGVHHTADVIASFVIAGLSAYCVHIFIKWREHAKISE